MNGIYLTISNKQTSFNKPTSKLKLFKSSFTRSIYAKSRCNEQKTISNAVFSRKKIREKRTDSSNPLQQMGCVTKQCNLFINSTRSENFYHRAEKKLLKRMSSSYPLLSFRKNWQLQLVITPSCDICQLLSYVCLIIRLIQNKIE